MSDTPQSLANAPTDSQDETSKQQDLFAQIRWPIAIVAMLAVHAMVVLLGATWAIANASSFAVPADYVDGKEWDAHRAEMRASEALGWQLIATPSVMADPLGKRRVVFELKDQTGAAIPNAEITVRLAHAANVDIPVETTFKTDTEGRYAAELRMRKPGQWKLRAKATVGEQTFATDATLWIATVK